MEKKKAGIALLLAAVSAILRYQTFAQTPYANGWDSYFYLVQVKSWVEQGAMHSPEASLIYPFLRGVLFFTGDYVQMYKVGAAVLAGLFTFMIFVVAQLFGSPLYKNAFRATPMLISAWTVCSPQLSNLAAQYPKNLLGLILWLGFAAALEKKGAGRWAFALLVVNYFGHRLTFALAVLYGILWLLLRYRASIGRWFNRKTALATGLLLVCLGLAPRLFPGLFQIADVGRLGNILHGSLQFAPYSFVQTFGWERLTAWWALEIAFVTLSWAALGLIFLTWVFFLKPKKAVVSPAISENTPIAAVWLLCACLLSPFLEWSYTGISYRFFLVFVLLGPLLWCVFEPCVGRNGSFVAYLGTAIFVLGGCWTQRGGYNPIKHDPNYADFNRITTRIQDYFDKNKLEKPELLICHNALAEYYTFSSGTDAMPWLPEYPIDSIRLWRVAAGVQPQTLRYFARSSGNASILPLGKGYVLLPEYCWQSAIRMAEKEGDLDFLENARSWLNPYKKRPLWLLKRKNGAFFMKNE